MQVGYQSHYIITTIKGYPVENPCPESKCFDELVIGQETQIVPAFILRVDVSKIGNLVQEFDREIVQSSPSASNHPLPKKLSKPKQVLKPVVQNHNESEGNYWQV